MTVALFITVLGLLTVAAVCDLRTRQIPDVIAMCVLLLAFLAALFGVANLQWWMLLTGGLCGLLIGAVAFYVCNFGGGDAKLIAAIGTLLGPVGLLIALFWTALAGGILAGIAWLRGERDFAYAPAIAAGFAAYIVYPGGVLRSLMESFH